MCTHTDSASDTDTAGQGPGEDDVRLWGNKVLVIDGAHMQVRSSCSACRHRRQSLISHGDCKQRHSSSLGTSSSNTQALSMAFAVPASRVIHHSAKRGGSFSAGAWTFFPTLGASIVRELQMQASRSSSQRGKLGRRMARLIYDSSFVRRPRVCQMAQ